MIPLIVFEKWPLTKNLTGNLTDPDADVDADAGVMTIRKVELKMKHRKPNLYKYMTVVHL